MGSERPTCIEEVSDNGIPLFSPFDEQFKDDTAVLQILESGRPRFGDDDCNDECKEGKAASAIGITSEFRPIMAVSMSQSQVLLQRQATSLLCVCFPVFACLEK